MMKFNSINIGNKIKSQVYKQGIGTTRFSKLLGINPVNASNIYRRHDIHPKRLREICIILNHNFFQYYLPKIENDENSRKEALLNASIHQLTQEVQEHQNTIKALEQKMQEIDLQLKIVSTERNLLERLAGLKPDK